MIDESLKQYLLTKTKLEEDKITRLLTYEDVEVKITGSEKESILNALDAIKIIDPACGSGAFPMGILHKMLLILQKVDPESEWWLDTKLSQIESKLLKKELGKKLKDENVNYVHKLGIIQSSIYGVDIQPIAVEISKLRFFLSLIVEETVNDTKENRGIEPLPNLEFKFVCANSLIGLPKKEPQQMLFEAVDDIKVLRDLRDDYLRSYGDEKKKIEKKFQEVQSRMFRHSIGWGGKDSQTLKLAQWSPFSEEPCSWFDPDWMFGLVNGFDVVIANPPYLALTKERTGEGYSFIKGNNNTYVAFLEFALRKINKTGVIAYIIPTTWLAGNNYQALRQYLLDSESIKQIIQLPYDMFESAYVDNLILILTGLNHPNREVLTFKFNIKDNIENKIMYQTFDIKVWKRDPECLIYLNKHLQGMLNKYRNIKSKKLEEIAEVQRGTLPPQQRDFVKGAVNTKGKAIIPWFDHQVYRYKIQRGCLLKVYYDNLKENKPLELFECEKLLGRQLISRKFRLQFTYFNERTAFKKNLYAIYNIQKRFLYSYLLAILNSKFYSYIQVNLNCSGQRDDFPAFSLQDYRNFLIPDLGNEQKDFADLANKILSLTNDSDYENNITKQSKFDQYDRKIDEMVYDLYGLTKKEIKIVENYKDA